MSSKSLSVSAASGGPSVPLNVGGMSASLADARTVPGWFATGLFFLLFSGPPQFRLRDPTASLDQTVDVVILVQAVVWIVAGAWVAWHLYSIARRGRIHWGALQKLSLLFIAIAGVSVAVSVAPLLTAFKVFQMAVGMLFTWLFVEKYGAGECLDKLFWNSVFWCAATVVAAILAPTLVFNVSETGVDRLRGELLVPAGEISAVALILLIGWMVRLSRPLYIAVCFLSMAVLLMSLERTAYVAVLVFLLLTLWRGVGSRLSVWLTRGLVTATAVFFFAGGLKFLEDFRDPDTVWTLSDRLGLWAYLGNLTLTDAPWTGFGYYAASRLYGPEYNPGLGTAHSMFAEALVGTGFPGAIVLTVLCVALVVHAVRLLLSRKSRIGFVVTGMVFFVLVYGAVGAPIDSGPVAISFWAAISLLAVAKRGDGCGVGIARPGAERL